MVSLSVAIVFVFTIWHRRRWPWVNSESGSNSKPALHNTNPKAIVNKNIDVGITNTTGVEATSGPERQSEDINQHDQPGQGQSQVITESSTITTTAVVSARGHDHQYDHLNHHNQTAGQSQSQAFCDGDGVCAHGRIEFQANTESLVTKSPLYNTEPNVLNSNLYTHNVEGQYQTLIKSNTNTTAVMASGDDQTGQGGQSQAIAESNTNTTATIMASGHDQTGQGQSQAIAESNTNTTATVVTSGHDQTEQSQSQAIIESLNAPRSALLAALRPNPMYEGLKIPPKDPTSTDIASGHD
ncbi:hypothetical protein Bbelb_099110 [Branchiostoma belcheri]|nr:hypothetical protein Bbelb_099110 [Branchiostoma belcheri]